MDSEEPAVVAAEVLVAFVFFFVDVSIFFLSFSFSILLRLLSFFFSFLKSEKG